MSNQTDFRLPGHRLNQVAERKLEDSFQAAYSRQWNARNLEAPWYDPWVQIFSDLVAGHASLSAAPQAYLWYDLGSQGHEPHAAPAPPHLMSTEDGELDELQDDVGNITLDSIASLSVPSHRNRCRIPDISILRKVSFTRPQSAKLPQLARRVTYVGYVLLAELKGFWSSL
ncbi:hypothetical protein JVT61DRAFT_12366 [Boletus reticuloceps]|uniref:Uncharacterized protein n=1 Tax=Boletus reticuloceps TaxID=495285 RepID=A0A8I2YE54_9AGAM|nr:hypothetical protein JVT61DRAFT_12366 [Boletus reticuloceps]